MENKTRITILLSVIAIIFLLVNLVFFALNPHTNKGILTIHSHVSKSNIVNNYSDGTFNKTNDIDKNLYDNIKLITFEDWVKKDN